jgi:predicted dienelactone hydrolase
MTVRAVRLVTSDDAGKDRGMRIVRLVATAVLLAAAIRSARADDACLAGASLLGDQRAIATWRTDVDATCPCATAASRGHYRKCAKTVLDSLVVDGTVRTACNATAKGIIKGAVCGSTRIACGRVQASSKVPVSCRVKPMPACTDRAKYDQTACTAETVCADVVDWTAGTCSDVRVRGPFGVGARVVTMTKPSAVDPTQTRVLDTVVWYPTSPGASPIDAGYAAVLDAPLDASGGPYPVLMFSHGSCGYPLQSNFLLPLIASRGFVVVAPPHPGNEIFDGPSCSSAAAQVASFVERPQDIKYALDQMLAANADASSPFFGALDPTRLGMSGHSFGGLTTYVVVQHDPRYRMAVPMAPAGQVDEKGVTIPSLTMISQLDSLVNNDANRQAYANSSAPKYLVEILNAGHFAYSDGCFPGFPDCNPPVTLTQDEAHAVVLRWVVPFVQWKLGDDDRFAAFFEPPMPPGVTLDAAP